MISPKQLRDGLSDEEVVDLDAFLSDTCVPKGGMPISMMDGYLTAIASCPEFVPPSEWMPRIWHSDDASPRKPDDESAFDSPEEAQRYTSLVIRRMNEILRDFDQQSVAPLFADKISEDGTRIVYANVWCVGYLQGTTLHPKAWEPLTKAKGAASEYLAPIVATALPILTANDADDEELTRALTALPDDEVTQRIPEAAYRVYEYSRTRRPPARGTVRRPAAPGRNSQCVCGSGKKFKKCCGAA